MMHASGQNSKRLQCYRQAQGCILVGSSEIQAQAAGSGGDEEKENRGGLVEAVAQRLPLLTLGGAVQPRIVVACPYSQLLYDVQHFHAVREHQHLCTYPHTVTGGLAHHKDTYYVKTKPLLNIGTEFTGISTQRRMSSTLSANA